MAPIWMQPIMPATHRETRLPIVMIGKCKKLTCQKNNKYSPTPSQAGVIRASIAGMKHLGIRRDVIITADRINGGGVEFIGQVFGLKENGKLGFADGEIVTGLETE